MRPIYSAVKTDLSCFLVEQVLSDRECDELVAGAEAAGFAPMRHDYPPSYRDNDRLVRDDPALAARLFARLQPLLPARLVDDDGQGWRLAGLNARFRWCRYRDGQAFSRHRDGAHAPDRERRSRLTCMTYLDDAARFEGGRTRFYAGPDVDAPLLGSIRPRRGSMIVFDHALWHDGEPVRAGTKRVMRTDVLYAAEAPRRAGHAGYVWSVIARRDGTLASASRDRSILCWRRRRDRWTPVARLEGHQGSVLALAADRADVLWSASRDRTVRRWEGGASRVVGAHQGAVLSLAALDDGTVASGGADGEVTLWSGGAARRIGAHDGWIWALVALGPDRLASGSEDGTVRVWSPRTGRLVESRSLGVPVRALAFSPRGGLACGDREGWVLTPGGGRRVHRGAVCALAWLSSGLLASGGEDGAIQLLEGPGLEPVASFHHGDQVRGLAPLAAGRLASASYDGTVRVWDTAAPAVRHAHRPSPARVPV